MKKVLYSILGLLLLIMPTKVFAAGYISPSTSSLNVYVGETGTFTITAYDAIGDVTISSSNTGIATVSPASWGTGMVGEGETKRGTITVRGVSVGTTTVNVVVDGANFSGESVSGTRTVTINVSNRPVSPKPSTQPSKPSQPADTRSSNTNLKSVKVNGREVNKKDGQYVLELSNYITNVDISAVVEDSKSKVTGADKKDIIVGNNSFDLVVTAENGKKTTYKVVVVRKEYNLLSDLEDIIKQGIDADIVINKDDKLTSSDLDKIKNGKNKITLKVVDGDKVLYKWILDNSITSVNEFNPNIGLDIEDNDDMGKALNYPDGIYLDFRNCKDIPKGAILRYYVSNKYKDGDKINIYIYDENSNKVTELKNGLVATDGYVEFEISKSLRHVITKANVGGAASVEEESGMNIWIVVSAVLGLLLVICFIALITKKGNNSNTDKVENNVEEIKPVVTEIKPVEVDVESVETEVKPVEEKVTTEVVSSEDNTVSSSDVANVVSDTAVVPVDTDINGVPEITGIIPVEEVKVEADTTDKI